MDIRSHSPCFSLGSASDCIREHVAPHCVTAVGGQKVFHLFAIIIAHESEHLIKNVTA